MAELSQFWGTGRRKTSVARVRLAPGTGNIQVNRRSFEQYFPSEALRAEVRRYVRARLQDVGLCPESIARAHALSVRALHALFEDSDESVAGLVRRERLARCFEDLERPSAGSVTEIAFRWGFRDAAHFSRVFKREFDVTPSEVRHAALALIDKESGALELDRRRALL